MLTLEILKNDSKFSKITKFYGENSIFNSKKLFSKLEKNFKSKIFSATFIKNRRWNLELNNLIILILPEIDIQEAILKYEKINNNFSDNDLKDIKSIDLRFKDQVIIRYNDI